MNTMFMDQLKVQLLDLDTQLAEGIILTDFLAGRQHELQAGAMLDIGADMEPMVELLVQGGQGVNKVFPWKFTLWPWKICRWPSR